MAETPRGRLTVAGVLAAWFALVVAIGASAALDPVRGFGVPALGLTVGLPVAALVSAFLAFGPIRAAMLAAPLPALVAVNAVRTVPAFCLCFSTLAANCRRRSRRAQAGATFSPASRRCPSPGRSFASAGRSRRSSSRGASSGSQISSTRSRLARYRRRVRFRFSLDRPTASAMTALPWLLVPGFLVPILMFIHIVIVYRLLARTKAPARPMCGAAAGGQPKSA